MATSPSSAGATPTPPSAASTPPSCSPSSTSRAAPASPSADVQIGMRLHTMSAKLILQGTLYNAFDVERYEYDPSNALEPRLDITPNQFAALRVFFSATYAF